MASSSQMLMAGLAFVVNTFMLIYSALIGDKIFQPLLTWYYSYQYDKPTGYRPWYYYMGVSGLLWNAYMHVVCTTIFIILSECQQGSKPVGGMK